MPSPVETLRFAALGMQPGETTRNMLCPFCRKELGCFRLTRYAGRAVYQCYRAKCSASGSISIDGELAEPNVFKSPAIPVFDRPVRALNAAELRTFKNSYELTETDLSRYRVGISTTSEDCDAVHIPVHNGVTLVAHWLKTWPRKPGCKKNELVVVNPAYDGLYIVSPAKPTTDSALIVVEDPISAIKASRYGFGVALLGTTLSIKKVEVLQRMRSKVILCLDPGTESTAAHYMERFGGYFKEFHVLHLRDDLKRVPFSELETAFSGVL